MTADDEIGIISVLPYLQSMEKNNNFQKRSGKGRQSLPYTCHENSYVKLDHMLYLINYGK